jgi:hypothetical protein
MLVSHSHRFIYIKTKKTAGTSVEVVLQRYCLPEGIELEEKTGSVVSAAGIVGARLFDDPVNPDWYNHMPAVEIAEKLGADLWARYTKLCVVRNPWDKMVSWYWYHNAGIDFRRWLPDHLMSDAHLYRHADGRLAVDFVLRYENLAGDLAEAFRRLRIEDPPPPLPRLKSGYRPKGDYRDYYDAATRAMVSALYAREIEEFGYRF